jgi:hypothetical protein
MLGGLLSAGLVLVMFDPVEFVMLLPVKVHLLPNIKIGTLKTKWPQI